MIGSDVRKVQDELRQLDVVFVIDTTSSMEPSISEVRTRLRDFVNQLAKAKISPSVAIGVVAYRDHPPQDCSYVTQVYALTENVDTAQANINRLAAQGGGDGPEAVLDGLYDALNVIKWRKSAHKVVLLVGDAPPHGAGASGDHWPKGCPCGKTVEQITAQAQMMGITTHTVGVGSDKMMAQIFKQIAIAGEGEFVPLAKVEMLIERILDLLRTELGKVAEDIDTYGIWATSNDRSTTGLAAAMGKSVGEVDESLRRLRAKGVLGPDAPTVEQFRSLLGSASPGISAPALEVDPAVLEQIKIDESTDDTNPVGEDSIDIRLLDE